MASQHYDSQLRQMRETLMHEKQQLEAQVFQERQERQRAEGELAMWQHHNAQHHDKENCVASANFVAPPKVCLLV